MDAGHAKRGSLARAVSTTPVLIYGDPVLTINIGKLSPTILPMSHRSYLTNHLPRAPCIVMTGYN